MGARPTPCHAAPRVGASGRAAEAEIFAKRGKNNKKQQTKFNKGIRRKFVWKYPIANAEDRWVAPRRVSRFPHIWAPKRGR